jgi:hypothetical protein
MPPHRRRRSGRLSRLASHERRGDGALSAIDSHWDKLGYDSDRITDLARERIISSEG